MLAPPSAMSDATRALAAQKLDGDAGDEAMRQKIANFIAKSNVDEKAAAALWQALPAHQRFVMDRGTLADTKNPSAALVGRLRDAQRPGATGTNLACQGVQVNPEEVEAFIAQSALDDRAMQGLRSAAPEVQRLAMDRGSLSDANNPSAALLGRLRDAAQALSYMAAGGGVGPQGGAEAVAAFIVENGIDESAAEALTSSPPDIQRAVLERGSLKDARNPSAAVLGRIRAGQQAGMWMGGMGGGRWRNQGKGGGNFRKGGGKGGGKWMGPGMNQQDANNLAAPGALGAGGVAAPEVAQKVEQFIAEGNLDQRAIDAIRQAPPQMQQAVLYRGSLSDARNPSAALVGRLRDAQTAKAQMGWWW